MPSPLEITFIGHACLRLQCENHRLLTDPYNSAIGYAPVDLTVDVVSLSHENLKYHSCLDDVTTDVVVRGLENLGQAVESGPFVIRYVEVFEKLPDGAPDFDGPNAMALIEAANLRVLHMGDCGHLPTPAQTQACGKIDVLLALAGAGPTIELPDLLGFARAIEAKIIIPMHFGLPDLDGQFAPVSELENLWEGAIVRQGPSCQMSREHLPDTPELWVLQPLRQK